MLTKDQVNKNTFDKFVKEMRVSQPIKKAILKNEPFVLEYLSLLGNGALQAALKVKEKPHDMSYFYYHLIAQHFGEPHLTKKEVTRELVRILGYSSKEVLGIKIAYLQQFTDVLNEEDRVKVKSEFDTYTREYIREVRAKKKGLS